MKSRGGEVVSCEAHETLWLEMATFREKFPKLLRNPSSKQGIISTISIVGGVISSQAEHITLYVLGRFRDYNGSPLLLIKRRGMV